MKILIILLIFNTLGLYYHELNIMRKNKEEVKIKEMENILMLSIKCIECGNKANYQIYRIYEPINGKFKTIDKLLCTECLTKYETTLDINK